MENAVEQTALDHECDSVSVCVCVRVPRTHVCPPQSLEPIQGFRGDHTTQWDNQWQAHAVRREDINTGTTGQGPQGGREWGSEGGQKEEDGVGLEKQVT